MTSHIRTFLAAAGVCASVAAFLPAAHAQGFGGMFSGFNMNGVTQDEEETSTVITASAADIDLEHNVITLIGDVVVDDHANKITCNKMTIYLEEDSADSLVGKADKPAEKASEKKEEKPAAVTANGKKDEKDDGKKDEKDEDDPQKNISKIICSGDVVYTKRANPDDPNGQDQVAMSEQADYDAIKEVIVMTGNPVMMQGSNKMYGDRIEIIIKEGNRMRVINPKVYYTGESFLSSPGSNR
jgi:lipopolysaccharide export system protein LptA